MSCSKCNVACKHCYISYKDNFTAEELKENHFKSWKEIWCND